MKILSLILSAATTSALLATGAQAQWAEYEKPTAADWTALAELPDFSGVWERGGGGGGARGAGGGARGAAPGGRGAAPGGRGAAPGGRGAAPGARGAAPGGRGAAPGARGAAPGGRGGGGGGGVSPTPEYAALRDQLRANAAPAQSANCLPPGMPAIMTQPYPMEILLTPGKVTIVIEAYTQVRHIYTDGRELPEFPDPSFFGTSVGHWEGDTLVVESIGFNDLVTISGVPHSDEMKITERFSLLDDDTLLVETTITDPLALTQPYTTSGTYARHRDWTIAEYICQENNRNFVTSGGEEGIILDNPGGLPPPPN